MSEENTLQVTYTETEVLHAALAAIPLKGEGILSAVKDMVLLHPHIDVLTKAREKIWDSHAGKGIRTIERTHPAYPALCADIQALSEKVVIIKGIEKIKKEDLNTESLASTQGAQSLLQILVVKGLLEL